MAREFDVFECENVKLVCQTEMAGLFDFLDYNDEPEWIPWVLVEEGSIAKDNEVGVLIIPVWKAKEIGFEL